MKHLLGPACLLALLAAGHSPAAAQAASTGPAIEASAMEALNKMGAYLRTLKSFEVVSEVASEDVLTDGQKVQHSRKVTMLAEPPSRLRARLENDAGTQFYLFDGKTFTLYSRDDGYYATVAAPTTLAKLDEAVGKYGVNVPLADLFLWGRDENTPPKITAAADIGPATVDGVTCHQYVFRQEGLDWQLWIQLGNYPLPRKLVLTTTTDEARPQNVTTFRWNLAPSYNETAFTFTPPANAKKIIFEGEK